MPITSLHPSYKAMLPIWRMCRDAYDGERAIKAGGETYLPRLTAQDSLDYQNYLTRATFFGITAKTVSALVGLVTSKPTETVYPEFMTSYFTEGPGIQFNELCNKVLTEVINVGRLGLLVDAAVDGSAPYISIYPTESIINWSTTADGTLQWVVLEESTIAPTAVQDKYSPTYVKQYRELSIESGSYSITLYDEAGRSKEILTPTVGGRPLYKIPFTVISATGVHVDVDKPPMEDIASLNISHYRSSADLEWGRHFTGLPTPVVSGVDSTTTLRIGGTAAWVLPNENAKAMFLEFTGQGLQSLENALKEKQSQLASMSARMIDTSTRGSEAYEAVRLRYLSETASLSEVVSSLEQGFRLVYADVARMLGEDHTGITINMPRDYLSARLTATELNALIDSYLKGGITVNTLVYNLRRGEMLSPTHTDADELAGILDARKDVLAAKSTNRIS